MQAQKDFVDNLRAKSKIEFNDANLAKVRIDTSAAGDDGHGHDAVPPPAPPVVPGAPVVPKGSGGAKP